MTKKISIDKFYKDMTPDGVERLHKIVFDKRHLLKKVPEFNKHLPAILNATSHKEAREMMHKADKESGGVLTHKIRGGTLENYSTGNLGFPNYSKLQPNGYNPPLGGEHWKKGGNDYNKPYIKWIEQHPWMYAFGDVADPYIEKAREMHEQMFQYQEKVDELTKKQKAISDKMEVLKPIVRKIPPPMDESTPLDPRLQQYRDLISQINDVDLELEDAKKNLNDSKNYKSLLILDPASQKEWLRGYDEIQQSYNTWSHEVWRNSLSPSQWEPDSPYNLGKIWAAMYNRSWQPQHDWRSTGEMIWDKFKEDIGTFAEIGKTIAEVVV